MQISNLKEKTAHFLATGFYSGLVGKAPGTFGSVVAAGAYALTHSLCTELVALGLILSSILLCNYLLRLEKYQDNKDPKEFVIDEFAGFFVAVAGLPFSVNNLALSFVLFRFFDISKVAGIKRVEKWPRGYGITMDDVLAGIYSNILMRLFLLF